MSRKIVAGNWKMNTSRAEAKSLAAAMAAASWPSDVTVILCVPAAHLADVSEAVRQNPALRIGAQNCHHLDSGAYTGEISVPMLQDYGVTHVILGHSERRAYNHESNKLLADKLNQVLKHGLTPLFCCGEPLDIRDKGTHVRYVARQLRESLFHLDADTFSKVVIAYEPIWAIGTGRTASPEQAQEMHAAIRKLLKKQYGAAIADGISILYGGSCNAQNAKTLFALPDVDGGLIGGASLKAADFTTIANSY